jgi:hypothetical protein
MGSLIRNLIPNASAQTLDAVSQPTFGAIDTGGASTITGSVLLTTDKTAVKVGETFKVRIEIKTNDVNITEYRIAIDFDPTKFKVVDADTQTQGTQIRVLDDIFTIQNIQEDNTVASVGRIRLKAVTPSAPIAVNKIVAEFEMQAQAVGTSAIKIVEGSTGTQLVRQAGVGLAYTSNEISIQITTQQQTTTTTGQPTTTGSTTTSTTTTGQSTTTTGTQIPATAIGDSLFTALSLLGGLCLIVLGFLLRRGGKRQ